MSVIDPRAGAPVAQASIFPSFLFDDPFPALSLDRASAARASILPVIREALEEETATAKEEAREKAEMREAMKVLAAFAERPRDLQGLITVRLRIDQEGKFQIADVRQQTDKFGFCIVTDVGNTLIDV